jgi:diguanylate cyclase (GGDEF)-like protein
MQPAELLSFLQHAGRDPSRLIFEDELTGINNRRFLHSYLEHKVRWQDGTDFPLSLLLIDLDHFKDINDTHGHAAGDQLLTWVATVLREVSGEDGLPVRFGGDEFILLLPQLDGKKATEVAARMMQRIRDRPFRLREADVAVPVTFSIGVATAPGDATDARGLLQAADTALYHAKHSGRDQATAAAGVDPTKVFPKTALHRLLVSGIAGRDTELRVVSEALVGLGRGQSHFLLFESPAGLGKTTLLDTIGRNLATESFVIARVAGDPHEGYRPYSLATRILTSLLDQLPDKGAAAVQGLPATEVAHLALIAPRVGGATAAAPAAEDSVRRQRTFAALARFIPRIVGERPLVLLCDDLHFADEATLLLFHALLSGDRVPLLVAGTTIEPLAAVRDPDAAPIERFYRSRARELGIRRFKLAPLTRDHIGEYLRSVFPNVRTPDGFEAELARITQGNPLFLAEIIRKLVADRRVTLTGQAWEIAALEDGYLPRSLEQIVREKIAAMDSEGRRLLEQAAAMGDGVPVSQLAGSAELDETRVLEFLDRAEALGLVSLDFQLNDDVMRFLGKQVLAITYDAMDEERRQGVHERVGSYQEQLFERRLLPSASLLAYHFKRSANQEKARRYEQAHQDFTHAVFDPLEAERYTAELLEEDAETESRLAPQSVGLVPGLIRGFMTAVRYLQLYPPENPAIPLAIQALAQAMNEILEPNPWLHLSHDRRVLLVNGQRIDTADWGTLADSFVELLDRFELSGLTFQRGLAKEALETLVTTLAGAKPDAMDPNHWKRFARERGLGRIQPVQVRYSKVIRRRSSAIRRAIAEEQGLDATSLAEIPRILRALQAGVKAVRLYPPDSEPVAKAADQLHDSLREVLRQRETLTFATADRSLLANGVRVDATAFQAVAAATVELLDTAGLESVTIFSGVPVAEISMFLAALRSPPPAGSEKSFWDGFARQHGLVGLAFNQRRYALHLAHGLLGDEEGEGDEGLSAEGLVERLAAEPLEELRRIFPRVARELLVKGEHALVRRLVRRLFEEFPRQPPIVREEVVQACRVVLERLILGLQHRFAQLAVDPLLGALEGEQEPIVLRDLSGILHDMAGTAVQFADHHLATRMLLDIRLRRQQLAEGENPPAADTLTALFDRRLEPQAMKLLEEDMRSGEPERHERAAQVLGALGPAGIPMLIEVIKQENDFRIRQLAARLLAETGTEAAVQIKRALVTEVIVEQRARMLEVIDAVTRDLRHELQQCLRDGNPKVRRAAFRLFERLGQDELIDLVFPYARHPAPGVARAAIRGLASLRTPAALQALASVLSSARESALAELCCQALGQSDHPVAIEALDKALGARKFLLFGRRWTSEVRATAAMALKRITHPEAAGVLARYANDQDDSVRFLAAGLGGGPAARPPAAVPDEEEEEEAAER